MKEKLRQLAGEVSRGKETWPDASQPEIKRDCDRIDGFIDVITADLDNITKKYNEVAQYATDTDTITPIAVMIDEQNTEFEQIVEDYRAFISQHVSTHNIKITPLNYRLSFCTFCKRHRNTRFSTFFDTLSRCCMYSF